MYIRINILFLIPLFFSFLIFSQDIEEIIVKGEYREKSISEEDSSIVIIQSEKIKSQAIKHFQQLSYLVPNLNYAASDSRARYFQIRGIGERSGYQGTPNSSVGFLIDDIDYSGQGGIATLFDVDQVEVFRGPQGSRTGANALAGLIYIKTKDPQDLFEANGEITLGNYGRNDLSASINIPFSKNIKSRLSIRKEDFDGFRENLFLKRDDTSRKDEQSLRFKTNWLINETASLDLVYFDKATKEFSFDDRNFNEKSPEEILYSNLVLGLRDYVEKNNFPGVVIGISGGIDSAFSACVAVDALGSDKVKGIMMPSKYTSDDSINDATLLGKNLNIEMISLSIEEAALAYESTLKDVFKGTQQDITEENIQSRIRGMLLMAYSNKFGFMVMTNGNKSEVSVGYSTLYGDMCGGFSVIKDLYKVDVYRLSEWRNLNFPAISLHHVKDIVPKNIITKAPTAELKPNQKDADSLPPYDILDKILYELVEKESSITDIVNLGFDEDTVIKVQGLLYNSEYKRRQSAPGVKVSERNFGLDRRYPITNRFRDTKR